MKKETAILLMHCADQKGIVAHVTEFINENGGNIVYLDQHVDRTLGRFFMRISFEIHDFAIPKHQIEEYFNTLIALKYQMVYQFHFSSQKTKVAVFVSKMSHCLYDILSRVQSGEWDIEIPLMISNHPDLAHIAEKFDIPYYHLPLQGKDKEEVEKQQIALLKKHDIDLIILARYMQILSPSFIASYPHQIINIHHSFLPAFVGAKPYHAAHERGVKIIGATSHFVTNELDAGPIIEQDVEKVSHKDTVKDLIRIGKDIEKLVLSKAIWLQINHKLLVFQNKTIIFD